jgi:hypothetical protein
MDKHPPATHGVDEVRVFCPLEFPVYLFVILGNTDPVYRQHVYVLEKVKIVFTNLLKVRGQLRVNGAFIKLRSAYIPAFLGTGFYFEGQVKHLFS